MIKNYLKIAWRNMVGNKVYSAINILGLAAGMAVALLIALWVNNEYSYDKFLPDSNRSYQVRRNFNSNGETLTFSSTSLKLADALRTTIPEIEYVAESDGGSSHGLMVGDKKIYLNGILSGSDFFNVFKYPMLQGNAGLALKDTYSIVLSRATAIALFGTDDVINKIVKVDNAYNFKVTGVIKDVPSNSILQFKYVIPFSFMEQTQAWVKGSHGSFGWNSFVIYTKLKAGTSYAQVAPKIKNMEKSEDNVNAKNSEVIMQPMQDSHLYSEYKNGIASGGFIEYIRIFSVVGILVLLIACVNFINLTTARSEKRAREVGIRKAIGSQRKHLIFQFLTESALTTFVSFLFALLFVQIALGPFNALTGTMIRIPFGSIVFWLVMMGCVLITALVAGSRPAFYLSSFNPVKVLKGTIQVGRSATFSRKILVVTQFSCSIALIISTVVIYRQIQYAKNRPTGYSINHLLTSNMSSDLVKNYAALKNDLLQSGVVESMTNSSSPATDVYSHFNIDQWPGKLAGETVEMGNIDVADDYFKTLGMNLLIGRNFISAASDTSNIIFNETAIKRLRLKDPINQLITREKKTYRIIGVVKDALMVSPFAKPDPTMFLYNTYPQDNIIYRLSPNVNPHNAVEKIGQIFSKYNPAYPFTYRFVDDDYNRKFSQEVLIGKLSGIFAGLAIFISCLGLFGLAAYIAEQRTKEIGVRKVLGATVSQLWFLLSKDFVLLVIISCVIASPLALYFLQNWLQKYDYRISIGPGVFLISAVAAIAITLLTISFQAIKAAVTNPVKSLRSE
ncbi:ABC transporter permease [Mucilaginibacter lappiensis]|uniref:ABC-type antimicrobial peptide transport system permease subunit n=1 Tax=Mucilaginibacter lappiensis TaxID=354630 RepID=A0A1N6X6H2_9SPHI|nr:ABC transporter permease [Mucilaginibacter lappiensis]MBB6109378.1 ABC-type antimicrobial peptide transport system permease subunit [Mucilaginibacter lappiensis]MBB6127615.1 ABC-type antimicrobial peptide transport system permease subunit [Mucilaginibacter lappiensis]SIQ97879.1 ABC-type antimicrobial peptide transport system, permease component [Mucilaginibacter lappiensis]